MSITTVTTKGQVTIPKRVRDGLGLRPGSKVSIEMEQPGSATVKPVGRVKKSDYAKRIEKVRGILKTDMTTDEIMQLLRGDP